MSKNPVAASIDPDAFLQSFCTRILEQTELGEPVNRPEYILKKIKEINAETARLVEECNDMVTDEASSRFLGFSAMVLAAYRETENEVPDRQVRIEILQDLVRHFFSIGIRTYVRDRFDIDAGQPVQAYDKAIKNFIPRGEKYLGSAFTYGLDEKGKSQTTFVVSNCFFLNYFERNSAPELTKIMCTVDTIWEKELNDGEYNISFTRPTLMSDGDDICRFKFNRTSP